MGACSDAGLRYGEWKLSVMRESFCELRSYEVISLWARSRNRPHAAACEATQCSGCDRTQVTSQPEASINASSIGHVLVTIDVNQRWTG